MFTSFFNNNSPFYYVIFDSLSIIIIIYLIVRRLKCNQDVNLKLLEMLDYAIQENDIVTSVTLLRNNPFLCNIRFSDKYTPFLRACSFGNTQLVKYMLENCNVDITMCTLKNESAFYLATLDRVRNRNSKDASCIHTLFHANADIDVITKNGYNALQLAAAFGHTSLVKWLLLKNANLFVLPSPYDLAKFQGHYETALLIKTFYHYYLK